MGTFQSRLQLTSLSPKERETYRRCLDTYRRLRPSLHGDRHILSSPSVIYQEENREAGQWEVYEYLSPDGDVVSVFAFRCGSPETEHGAVLRGLDPGARYRLESHSGQVQGESTGEELMTRGLHWRLADPLSADTAILTRIPS